MKDTDIAYIAGIIDGEGFVGYGRTRSTFSIRIVNTDWALLEWIRKKLASVAPTGHIYIYYEDKGRSQGLLSVYRLL